MIRAIKAAIRLIRVTRVMRLRMVIRAITNNFASSVENDLGKLVDRSASGQQERYHTSLC